MYLGLLLFVTIVLILFIFIVRLASRELQERNDSIRDYILRIDDLEEKLRMRDNNLENIRQR